MRIRNKFSDVFTRACSTGREFWWVIIPALIFLIHIVLIFAIVPAHPVKDEVFFFRTTMEFSENGSNNLLHYLQTYSSPQTPLVFIFFAVIMNISRSILFIRVINAMLTLIALVLFGKTLRNTAVKNGKREWQAAALFMLFAINPYLHLISVLFYTDSLYLLMVSSALYFITTDRRIPFYFSLFLIPLVRQFGVIFPIGSAVSDIINKKYSRAVVSACTLSGLALFVILWGGLMPQNIFSAQMHNIKNTYGIGQMYIVMYHLAAVGFYLSPLILWKLKSIIYDKKAVLFALACAVVCLMFPARQNYTNLLYYDAVETLGLFHKAVNYLFPVFLHDKVIALFAALAGGWIYAVVVKYKRIPVLFRVWMVLFFIMSYFNLQAWDKYLLDVLAVLCVCCLYMRPGVVTGSGFGQGRKDIQA